MRIHLRLKSIRSVLVVTERNFLDMFTIKNVAFSLILTLIFPLIIAFIPQGIDFGSISVQQASGIISSNLMMPLFLWTCGIALMIIIGINGSPIISEEISSGTLLTLISKPINRTSIFLGKYLALYLFCALVNFVSLFVLFWTVVLSYSGNVAHFASLFQLFVAVFFYSGALLFIFINLVMSFSSFVRKPRNSSTIFMIVMIVFYFVFLLIPIPPSLYEEFQLYHFDPTYHLGNIYLYFIEQFNAVVPSSVWQSFFSSYSKIFYFGLMDIDVDQGVYFETLQKTNYLLPQISLAALVLISICFLAVGIVKLNKREVNR